jgi:methyl-accepting chemotaxis protein
MDQGTQQNAAMVEESTAASHSLAREADALFQLIARFEIGGQSGAGEMHRAA